MNTIEEKIAQYCTEEGIGYERLPQSDKLEFGYNIKFPPHHPKPKRITIIQPKKRSFII